MSEDIALRVFSEADLAAIQNVISALQSFAQGLGGVGDVAAHVSAEAEQTAAATKKMGDESETAGKKIKGGFSDFQAAVTTLNQGMASAERIIGYVQKAIDATVGAYVRYADTVGDVAKLTGDSTENVSRLAGAFGAVGLSTGQLEGVLRPFNTQLAEMDQKMREGKPATGAFAEAMTAMGIPIRDSKDQLRSLADMFPEIVAGLNTTFPDGAQRSAAATAILGRSANELNDILELTPEQLDKVMRRADELGTVLSKNDVEAAEKLKLQIIELNQQLEATGQNIGQAAVPAFLDLAKNAAAATTTQITFGEKAELVGAKILDNILYVVSLGRAYNLEEQAQAAIAARLTEEIRLRQILMGIGGEIANVAAQQLTLLGWQSQAIVETTDKNWQQVEALIAEKKAVGEDTTELEGILKALIAERDVRTQGIQMIYTNIQARREEAAAARESALAGIDAVMEGYNFLDSQTEKSAGGGRNVAKEISDYLAEENQKRVDDAREAALEIKYWTQDQNEWIADNAAKLTPELQEEFRLRTKAAQEAADLVKDSDAALASELLKAESDYQRQKADIMADPKLSEEERAAKLAILDRENKEEVERAKETAALKAQIEAEEQAKRIQQMKEGGAAAGKAFMDALNPKKMAEDLDKVGGIFQKVIDTGTRWPTDEIERYKDWLDKAGVAIGKMNLPPAEEEALLALLAIRRDMLAEIAQSAKDYADAVARANAEYAKNPYQGNYGVPGGPTPGRQAGQPGVGMQHGGIVTRPTVALIGEAGPEAVVPLGSSSATDWGHVAGLIGAAVARALGGGDGIARLVARANKRRER